MRLFRVILFTAISSLQLFQHCAGQLNTKESEAIEKFTSLLTTDLQKDNLHGGISLLLLKNGEPVFQKTMGYKRASEDIATDSATIYCAGSVTKTFTATLLLQSVEEGKVKLDDPVEKYVPEIKLLKEYNSAKLITLRQLASHTAGLPREPGLRSSFSGPVEEWQNKLLASLAQTTVEKAPGKGYVYSNLGYALLGLALERATGTPYIQLIQQKILQPLRMDNSFFSVPDIKKNNLADGTLNPEEFKMENAPARPTLQNVGHTGWGYGIPNGGLYTTPADLATFFNALLLQKKLINEASLKEMKTVQPSAQKYGLGLMISGDDFNEVGHSGAVPGYVSIFRTDLKSGYAIVVMRNYKNGKTNIDHESWKLLSKLAKE